MKRLAWLFLLPLPSGALFAQVAYSIAGSVPNGTVGVSYSASLSVSPANTVTWAWSVTSGSLPPGLTISPPSGNTTTITGTPTTVGSYAFTVQASFTSIEANGISVKQAYSVTIGPPALTIPSASLADGVVGVSYSQGVTPAGGYGLGTYTFALTVGSLPPGLALNTTSGVIFGTPTTAGSYNFTLQVTSQSGTYAAMTAYGTFSINVTTPSLTITTSSSLPAGTVGVAYSQTLAATGGTPPYTWRLTGSTLSVGLTLATSGTISGTPTTAGTFTFQVTVIDSAQGSASGSFTIKINPAPLVITTTSLPAGTVGTAYTAITLAATGGIPAYTWSVASGTTLPSGLAISSAGVISGTPTTAGSFTFQVTVIDSAQGSASGSFTIKINPAPLVITTTSLPGGTMGTAYTATTLAATGGTPPYTWSVATGGLPSGLAISSAGVVSGTPTAAGTFSVTLKVTDSAQATATQAYSITVAAATQPLAITTQAPLPGGEVGLAYTQAFTATGGTPPYQWSVSTGTTLPTGLTLNAAGSLTGTPTAAGTFTFTVQVADSAARTATQAFSITVIAAVKITAVTPPGGVTGVSYTQQFAATGGVTPYVWSIASGSIPTGLSLSTTTGLLSGTPTTAGTYAFTLAVTDQNNQTDSAAFSITIVAPLSITTQAPLPGGVIGVAYTQTFAATGGTSPYQWSVSAGTAPTGLALNAAGSLTGTPTAAGTFNFTLQVADSASPPRTATASFTITVIAALTITQASPLPGATFGVAYNQALAFTGGAAPFNWSITSGTLPAGIALNPGSLNGIPSAPGTFTFTVSVTGGGQTATKLFTLTVGVPPAPSIAITGLPATATPVTQPALGITIPSAYPLAITGQVTLTFAPDSPSPDGGEVVFTTGGRTVSFTVPANTTQVVFSGATPGVQVGTVSGTITLTLKLTAAGIDITPSPAPSTTIVIAKAAPKIVSATVTGVTSSGFNLVVVGYATSREMVSATVTFTAAGGVTLSSSSATISLATVFTTWYQSSASAQYGSNFSLTIPFTIANGGTNPLASVSVVLTNAQGSSTSVSAAY